MATEVINKCLGLVSQFSPLATQTGTLAIARNCVNAREHVLENRRGYKDEATFANNIKQIIPYSGKVLVHHGDKVSYKNGLSYSDYAGSYTEPTGNRVRFAEAAGNLFFTTSLGVKKFTDTAGTTASDLGAPRCLDLEYSLSGASGFLSNNNQCAYYAVIKRVDANRNVLKGYPSQRLWVINSAGAARDVQITTYFPTECIVGDIIEVYRTASVATVTEDLAGSEAALVYQYTLQSADITNKYIQFVDKIIDALRGEALYSSPSQEGIQGANSRPPLAKDLALFKSSFLFYANCSSRQRLYFSLLSTTSLTGKTITLAGFTYNFGATEIISGGGSPQVKVFSTGVVASDLDNTARSLVRVINRYASNTSIYAYYVSGADNLPGQIICEARTVGTSAFTIQGSDSAIGAQFSPTLPVSPSTNSASTSTNDEQKNYLYFSKFQEFEHVPLLNYIPVGPSNEEILRIVSLKESLIIIKERGIYRLTGENSQSFVVTPIDLTVFCKALNSVSVLANQVIMLSNQGVVSISETGVQVISHEIEPNLKKLLTNTNLKNYTTALSYESERSYMLSTITDPSDTSANRILVYNYITKTWLEWDFAFNAAILEPNSELMYFSKNGAKVFVERKSFSSDDYVDVESSITVLSISGQRVLFNGSATPKTGDLIEIAGTALEIDSLRFIGSDYEATILGDIPISWVPGAATLYPSIIFQVEYNPWMASAPDHMKQVSAFKALTDNTINSNSATSIQATFKSNFDEETEYIDLGLQAGSWGTGPWGLFSWGGGADPAGFVTYVPANKQYCTRLSAGVIHRTGREKISLCGVAFAFNVVSDRIGK